MQFFRDRLVEVGEEVGRGGYLPLFDFRERVAEDTRLLFDVLEAQSAVGFELGEALRDGFEERFLSGRLRLG